MKQALLTVTEVSKALGVHPFTVRKWEKTGRIAPVPRNGRGDRMYSSDDIERLRRLVRGRGRPRKVQK